MPSWEERQRIKDEIDEIKSKLDDLFSEKRDLREAQREFLRESRKRSNRDVGYQGGDVDARLGVVEREISELRERKDILFNRLKG